MIGMQRYHDAIPHLQKALSHCGKWDGLEGSIRQMLVACYKKYMPLPPPDVTNEAADSRMLDALFHSGLGFQDLGRLLDSYFSIRGNSGLKWHVECTDESDTLSPFSFSVTFPGCTHATAGDTVTASIALKSNLSYSVLVKSITLSSMSGQITVPSIDLTSAENADKGTEGCIIMKPDTVARFSTDFVLPRNVENIMSGESDGSAEKGGSNLTSARPRTAGMTSGGKLVACINDIFRPTSFAYC